MKRRTIKINKDTREMLRELQSEDESVDMVIRRLFDIVNEPMQDTIWITGKTNVDISDDVAVMLKSYRISEHESFDSILRRALSLYLGLK